MTERGAGPRPRLLVDAAAKVLADAGVASPRADAQALLAFVLGVSRGELVAALVLDRALDDDGAVTRFTRLVDRRARREPLQHLTGTAPFRHVELAVGPGVFVPRPETETVAQVAVDEARRVVAERGRARVADLCTGSGAIALALADEVPGAEVHAVELDAAAHAWAARNMTRLTNPITSDRPGLWGRWPTAPDRVRYTTTVVLLRGDARTALRDLDGTVDVVVSNPPYVPSDAVPRDPEVARHDPAVALYGLGTDGLEVPRGITAAAGRLLRPGGLFVMEHAEVQEAAARAMVDGTGLFDQPVTRDDLTGRPRMVVARRTDAPVEH